MLVPVDAAEPPRHAVAVEVVACQCIEIPESNPNTDTKSPQFPYAVGSRLQYDYRVARFWSVGAIAGYEHVNYPGRDTPQRASVGVIGAVAAYRTNGESIRGGVRFAGGFAYANARSDGGSAWTTPGYFVDFDAELARPLSPSLDLFLDVGIVRLRRLWWGADRPRYGASWAYGMFIVPLSGSVGVRYRF